MKRLLTGLVLALSTATATIAAPKAFRAPYGIDVYPVKQDVFEVVINSGNGYGFWCGAADYARRALGVGWQEQIVIVREMGRSEVNGRRSAVQFTTNPEALGITPRKMGYSVNGLNLGEAITIQKGFSYCDKRLVYQGFF